MVKDVFSIMPWATTIIPVKGLGISFRLQGVPNGPRRVRLRSLYRRIFRQLRNLSVESSKLKKEKPVKKVTNAPAGQILPDDASTEASPLFITDWIKGKPVDVTDGKKIYVVEFWATWCPPCRTSIPHLTELQKEYKDAVTFVGVTSEVKGEKKDAIMKKLKAFVAKQGSKMGYTVAVDKGGKSNKAYQGRYKVRGIPHAYIISKKGNMIWHGHPMRLDGALKQVVESK